MATIDYKEKYEQALERAKYYHDRDNIQFLENIFPELCESDDERIRKELISFVRGMLSCHDKPNAERDEKYESWIAWLEKECEQKPVPDWMPKFLDELRSKKNYFDWDEHKDIEGCILAIIEWMKPNYFNGKDGEQKPDDKVKPKFKAGDKVLVDGKVYTIKLVNEDNYIVDENGIDVQEHFSYTKDWKLYEQKPTAWSEEDQKIWAEISDILWEGYKQSCSKFSWDDIRNWFKPKVEFFKNKVQPQPRQEWSEDDERLFQIVIDILDRENHLGNISHTDLIACVRKLKSLRPQSQWKPSNEQIDALDFAIDCIVWEEFCVKRKVLKGLLEQLKKFKI